VAQTSETGESWGIAMTLLEKPLTMQGITEQFYAFSRRFDFFGNIISESMHKRVGFTNWLEDQLEGLIERGWILREGDTYSLTEKGRDAANKARSEVERARGHVDNLATPENASKLTLIVHLFLAALKLPAGILSGSVGLLNDAIDTLLDGVASLMVYWGFRVNRVRHPMATNRLLFVLGLCFALYTVWAAVLFVVLLIATILSGIIEERRELCKRFGAQYLEYKQQVPRRYLTPWLTIYLGIAAVAFAAGVVL
jgi:hypothetical protein